MLAVEDHRGAAGAVVHQAVVVEAGDDLRGALLQQVRHHLAMRPHAASMKPSKWYSSTRPAPVSPKAAFAAATAATPCGSSSYSAW